MDTHLPPLEPPSGRIEGNRHFYPVRVFFEDTDLSGIAYHANHLKWCERARSDLLRCLGIDQRAAQEAGEGVYAVSRAAIHWRLPARLDDVLMVETAAANLRAASAEMVQTITRGGDVIARIEIVAAFLSAEGRPKRQPARWREAFERFIDKDIA